MQLLRLKAGDVDLSADAVTLYDGKGARLQPRRHVLPLTKSAHEILERRLAVTDISDKMLKADPPEAREPFQLRDLRRTVETQLAALRISSDVRAQLQSHGLGGIQQRHYDRHDYMLEKHQTLLKWAKHLEALKAGRIGDVVPMKRDQPTTQ
jgi:integrase